MEDKELPDSHMLVEFVPMNTVVSRKVADVVVADATEIVVTEMQLLLDTVRSLPFPTVLLLSNSCAILVCKSHGSIGCN